MVLDWLSENNWIILVAVIVLAVIIGGISLLIHKALNKDKKEEKPTEEQIAKETMDYYLEEVEDDKTKEEFQKYEEENKKEDK